MNQLSTHDLQQHVTIVGWLRIIASTLFLALAGFIFLLLTGIGVISNDPTALRALGIIGLLSGGLMAVLAIPGILAGIGLLKRQAWGRVLALVVSFFDLFNFPIGTAIAIYSFFILLQDSAAAYFAGASTDPALPR